MKKLIYIFTLLPLFSMAQVSFKSPEFEQGIRRHLDLSETDEITLNSMDTIRKIDLSGLGITDINDVIYLKKIRNLDLSNNQIRDVSPLLNLPHLQVLNIANNNIRNIAMFTFSNKRNFKLIVSGNEIEHFEYLNPATFANVEAIGLNRQKEEEPDFLLNDLFTATRTNGQAKIYYNIWDNTDDCTEFTIDFGDSNTNSSLQCNSLTNIVDYDYETPGFKEITITREDKTLITHFVAPYSFTYDMGQSYPVSLNLPSEINLISLENTPALGTAIISGNEIDYEPLSVGNDIIKVKYQYGTSNRTEVFYIFTTNTDILSLDDSMLINLKIYPNPFDDFIEIVSSNNGLIDKVEIYDILGKSIIQEEVRQSETHKLSTDKLAQGTYIVKITTDKACVSYKIIKR